MGFSTEIKLYESTSNEQDLKFLPKQYDLCNVICNNFSFSDEIISHKFLWINEKKRILKELQREKHEK